MATSGTYRKFKTDENGKRYAHIINTKTGYPSKTNILSVSVIAEDCMTADAFATAFMVMGKDSVIELSKKLKFIEVYLIFSTENDEMDTYYSDGFNQFLTNVE